ncbi:polysaccharide biosynthesis/export family protein [Sphingomonas sp.]|uniref:polysaccharide biosynthesis/export family protein n=1 Tax=Sphingomonas sp. TaxID=28214 RepID=UPI002CBD565F|nr:polysaccharide biosynthesis/export family protein [Sphingomonas sp.]HTG38420.1 polysaccharide biosynthesis/export family protein [Sphingomonas sp.]
MPSMPPSRAAALLAFLLAGCSSVGGSGPSSGAIVRAGNPSAAAQGISIVALDEAVARRTTAYARSRQFDDVFDAVAPSGTVIGTGDVLDIAIWEAPPAVLFGATGPGAGPGGSLAQNAGIPQQVVGEDGAVTIPFVGSLVVRGQTPQAVGRAIVARLAGRAHSPQAIVRLAQNDSRAVTVMGEVGATRRVPLTPRGERLLDAIAAAGGSRQPVVKTTVQLTRGGRTAAMPLDAVVRDPAQNVVLQPGDIVTVAFQPYSFVALGAVGQNAEVPFEGGGISLAQALGRIGGLRDDRADVRGVFIFRLEQPAALDPAVLDTARTTAQGLVPVVYRLDLGQGASFFTAQDFVIRDRDVVYVSNAPIADLQKFLNIVSSAAFSVTGINNAVQ